MPRIAPLNAAIALTALCLALPQAPARAGPSDNTLIMVQPTGPRHLNGAVQSGTGAGLPSTQIFASPLRYDDGWTPQPYLAESWTVSEDGLTVTLSLVQGATFHDGAPITSEDVKFSIEVIQANHPFTTMFEPVASIDTPDAHTVVLNLSRPHPALMLAMSPALCPILPKHIYGDGQDLKTHPANAAPVGSGPFMLEEFTPGDQVVLVKNPNFFIKGRPHLDKIIQRVIPQQSSLLISLEQGDSDMLPYLSAPQNIKRLQEARNITVTDGGYEGIGPIVWLAFNTGREKLADPRVRQAIAYATDRDFIIKALHRGTSSPQRGPIIESSPFFDPTIPAYDLDLERAQELMNEAGHADGMELTIDYLVGAPDLSKNVAEYLRSQLGKIGITVTVRTSPDFATWSERISNHDFDITTDIVFNWGDPVIGVHRTYLGDNIRKGVIWSNTQQYSNPEVDRLLAAAAAEPDFEKRRALYSEFQQIVARDLPVYWLNSVPYHTAYDARLQNPPTGIWGVMHPLDRVKWTQE